MRSDGRDPCPWRILDDIGGAFAMGAVGGGIWHAFKGAKNSPKGQRLKGSMLAVKTRAPILGGNFGVWGGLFSTTDCLLVAARGKDDHWNSIAAGFTTGGILAARAGPKMAFRSACVGGIFLGIIEGVSMLVFKQMERSERKAREAMMQAQAEQAEQQQAAMAAQTAKDEPLEKSF